MTTHALQRDRRTAPPDDFPEQLVELLAYLEDRFPADHPFARLAKLPGGPLRPDPWLLGSSPQSAIWAAELGLPYAFADFINANGTGIADSYLRGFMDSEPAREPGARRRRLGAVRGHRRGGAPAGHLEPRCRSSCCAAAGSIPVPPVDKAVRFLASEGESVDAPPTGRRSIVGTPGDGQGRPRGARRPVRRGRGDRRDDHPRPRSAPALLRAARRHVRARKPPWRDGRREPRPPEAGRATAG